MAIVNFYIKDYKVIYSNNDIDDINLIYITSVDIHDNEEIKDIIEMLEYTVAAVLSLMERDMNKAKININKNPKGLN